MIVGIIVIFYYWIFCIIVLNFRKMFVEYESYNVIISYNFIIFFKSYGVIIIVIFVVCKRFNYGLKSFRIVICIVIFIFYVFVN